MPVDPMREITDRRSSHRFSLRMAIECRQIEPPLAPNRVFVGESLNISSKGLLFTTTEAFQPGQVIEASIDWPMRLNNGVRLTLVVEGAIVRKADDHAAIRIDKYEFRTRGAERRSDPPKAMTTQELQATPDRVKLPVHF